MPDSWAYIGGGKFATSTAVDPSGSGTSNVLKVQSVGADGNTSSPSTAAVTSVDSQTAAVQLLAASTTRKGVTILNTDSNALYIRFGAGDATATDYSVQVPPNGYYEVPYGYTGRISGIWAADGTGAAKITAFS